MKLVYMKKDSTGSLLIVALWMLIIISAIVVAVSVSSGIEAKKTRAFGDRHAAIERARAAVVAAMMLIESDKHPLQDDQNDGWYAFERLSQRSTTERFDTLSVVIIDEERKFNVNGATPAMLEGLMARLKQQGRCRDLPADLFIQDLLAFRGVSDVQHVGGFSTPQGRDFSSVRELFRLPNVPSGQVRELVPYVTVYPKVQNMMSVNINTAPAAVLGAVMDGTLGDDGAKKTVLDAICDYRASLADTGNPRHFTREDLSAYKLLDGLGLQRDIELVSVAVQFLRWMTVDSTFFTVSVTDPAFSVTVDAVIGPRQSGVQPQVATDGGASAGFVTYEWYEYCTDAPAAADTNV